MSLSHESIAADYVQPPDHIAERESPRKMPLALVLGLAGALAVAGCNGNKAPGQADGAPMPPAASAAPFEGPTVAATPEAEGVVPGDDGEVDLTKRRSEIVRTALSYVWGVDDGGRRKTGFKNGYLEKARTFTGMTDAELAEPNNVMPETDCGLFVSMVMHESGADPEYPLRETNIQQEYLRKNSDPNDPDRKYDKLDVDSVKDLLAGDIAIYSRTIEKYDKDSKEPHPKDKKRGHTYLIIKSAGADGSYDNSAGEVRGSDDNPAASASWKDYSPKAVDISLTYRDNGPQAFSFYRLH